MKPGGNLSRVSAARKHEDRTINRRLRGGDPNATQHEWERGAKGKEGKRGLNPDKVLRTRNRRATSSIKRLELVLLDVEGGGVVVGIARGGKH